MGRYREGLQSRLCRFISSDKRRGLAYPQLPINSAGRGLGKLANRLGLRRSRNEESNIPRSCRRRVGAKVDELNNALCHPPRVLCLNLNQILGEGGALSPSFAIRRLAPGRGRPSRLEKGHQTSAGLRGVVGMSASIRNSPPPEQTGLPSGSRWY